jgi:hypothetical protein
VRIAYGKEIHFFCCTQRKRKYILGGTRKLNVQKGEKMLKGLVATCHSFCLFIFVVNGFTGNTGQESYHS